MDTGFLYGHVSLGTNFTLFSLHPYYSYSTTVTAVTVAPGPPSSPIVITTDQDGEYMQHIYRAELLTGSVDRGWSCDDGLVM